MSFSQQSSYLRSPETTHNFGPRCCFLPLDFTIAAPDLGHSSRARLKSPAAPIQFTDQWANGSAWTRCPAESSVRTTLVPGGTTPGGMFLPARRTSIGFTFAHN